MSGAKVMKMGDSAKKYASQGFRPLIIAGIIATFATQLNEKNFLYEL